MATKLPEGIEHVYTNFPEERVYIKKIEIPESDGNLDDELDSLSEQGIITVNFTQEVLQNIDLSHKSTTSLKLVICKGDSISHKVKNRFRILDIAKTIGIAKDKLPVHAIFQISNLINNDYEMDGDFFFDTETLSDDHRGSLVFSFDKSSTDNYLLPRASTVESQIHSHEYWVFSS
jgi:hypothetical protein